MQFSRAELCLCGFSGSHSLHGFPLESQRCGRTKTESIPLRVQVYRSIKRRAHLPARNLNDPQTKCSFKIVFFLSYIFIILFWNLSLKISLIFFLIFVVFVFCCFCCYLWYIKRSLSGRPLLYFIINL